MDKTPETTLTMLLCISHIWPLIGEQTPEGNSERTIIKDNLFIYLVIFLLEKIKVNLPSLIAKTLLAMITKAVKSINISGFFKSLVLQGNLKNKVEYILQCISDTALMSPVHDLN